MEQCDENESGLPFPRENSTPGEFGAIALKLLWITSFCLQTRQQVKEDQQWNLENGSNNGIEWKNFNLPQIPNHFQHLVHFANLFCLGWKSKRCDAVFLRATSCYLNFLDNGLRERNNSISQQLGVTKCKLCTLIELKMQFVSFCQSSENKLLTN